MNFSINNHLIYVNIRYCSLLFAGHGIRLDYVLIWFITNELRVLGLASQKSFSEIILYELND